MSISLVGLMGVGKSVVGMEVARRLGWSHIDLDAEIASSEGMNISDIFKYHGEDYFRAVEKSMLGLLLHKMHGDFVLSLGGGAFADQEIVKLLRDATVTIWLKAEIEVLIKRIMADNGVGRPLAMKLHEPNFLSTRNSYYAQAEYSLDTTFLAMEEVVNAIIDIIDAL